MNAYLIAFGGLLLLAGRLGDLFSRRGMFLAGQAVFILATPSATRTEQLAREGRPRGWH
ncbi:hypothetical protein ACQEVF_28555 [Nonomuraea polychroma]|uniref:hypothetical protein n=1 Tax=Nonomuraea polychroma TaxID=46176 RepID=UPI003D8CB0A0